MKWSGICTSTQHELVDMTVASPATSQSPLERSTDVLHVDTSTVSATEKRMFPLVAAPPLPLWIEAEMFGVSKRTGPSDARANRSIWGNI